MRRESKPLEGFFDLSVKLPEGLTIDHLERAMIVVRRIFEAINRGLKAYGMPPLSQLIRRNQYSGLVSDFMTRMLDKFSDFEKLPNTAFPDLRNPRTSAGMEVKATTRSPWSTVGHNVASGWFLTVEYEIDEEGLPAFRAVWVGELTEGDFVWRGRGPSSRRTPTGSVKKSSWDRKMRKVFERP